MLSSSCRENHVMQIWYCNLTLYITKTMYINMLLSSDAILREDSVRQVFVVIRRCISQRPCSSRRCMPCRPYTLKWRCMPLRHNENKSASFYVFSITVNCFYSYVDLEFVGFVIFFVFSRMIGIEPSDLLGCSSSIHVRKQKSAPL